ncbi:beta-N-acetylglucosaminidase domain-containing protein [Allostreptomyces psammosilenae]|uniref:Hyaluronoglucosaminidase n=1 Tax=Allostreptomyces psammosilenae TaxID=1892865 RepID=A0A853A697_9ACTN|nr:beta-N-acetylglucosaminidase domain-containing protein [Allostreptomyces psammosilenae]NYI08374.1 hyaluronoglucosaminidase [Allostreptomyces psammosilenae]
MMHRPADDGSRPARPRRRTRLRAFAGLTTVVVLGGSLSAAAAQEPLPTTVADTAADASGDAGRPRETEPSQVTTAREAADAAAESAARDGLGRGPEPATAPVRVGELAAPEVTPRPREVSVAGEGVVLTRTVRLVAHPGADPAALGALRGLLTAAGVRIVEDAAEGAAEADAAVDDALTIHVSGEGGAGVAAALERLSAAGPDGLPAGGYVLAVGTLDADGGTGGDGTGGEGDAAAPPAGPSAAVGAGTVVLAGVDGAGTFAAVQTLRQLVVGSDAGPALPAVRVRDWPGTPVRGLVEGFYGQPWSHQQRLAQLDFLGSTKQNAYLYAPADDPYRRARWREPYPADRADEVRELVARARANHVELIWAVAPGQSICHGSAADAEALTAKLESLWELGVRRFQIQFQDVSYSEWHCGTDGELFGSGPTAAARAQAHLVGEVWERLTARHPQAPSLWLLPTEHHQDGATEYRTALAEALHPSVRVAWTGVGVVPAEITAEQVAEARAAVGHPLVTMDDYPVNDYDSGRLFLGPYTGRAPEVATGSAALLANAMAQPVASRIALSTSGDFAWNPEGYDAQASWEVALRRLAGGDPAAERALRLLAENSASSPLREEESSPLAARIAALEEAEATSASGASGADAPLAEAARALRADLAELGTVPEALAGLADGELAREVGPWLEELAGRGEAGVAAVDALTALRGGDGAEAWRQRLAAQRAARRLAETPQEVGVGVLDAFVERVLARHDAWAGVAGDGRRATTTMPQAQDHGPEAMVDGRSDTYYWSGTAPQPGDAVGVDLGTVRPVEAVRVDLGSGVPGDPGAGDVLVEAELEYSDGAGGWLSAGRVSGSETVEVTLPEGTAARYLRLRATAAQDHAVAVREFAVRAPDAVGLRAQVVPVPADDQPTEGRPADGAAAEGAEDGGAQGRPAEVPPDVAPEVPADIPPDAPAEGAWPTVSGDDAAGPRRAVDGDLGTAFPVTADGSALVVRLSEERPLERLAVAAAPADPRLDADAVPPARVEVRAADGSWRELGELSGGWNEWDAADVRVDAVRVTWPEGTDGLQLFEVVPRYADTPGVYARAESARAQPLIGGDPVRVPLRLTSAAARDVEVAVRVSVDGTGVTASAPERVTLPRGGSLLVPVEVVAAADAPSGERRLVVRLEAEGRVVEQVVTVGAYPAVGSRDLAAEAGATSSGDETPDFPAAAAVDGDPLTRWSSPADDDAWLLLDLGRPRRVGEVVLRWQDAYAAAYRIEVSSDGRQWRTAATVTDGRGGVETVRMDAADTRFVRVQGVRRATKFGYSLVDVEVRAVAE